jgi:hypothetical protein
MECGDGIGRGEIRKVGGLGVWCLLFVVQHFELIKPIKHFEQHFFNFCILHFTFYFFV